MTPAGPHHFAIKVRDLPSAERFYCDVLGLSLLRRWPAADGDGAGDRSVWIGTGDAAGSFLAIETIAGRPADAKEDGSTGEAPGHHLLALRISADQRTNWEARLTAAGVVISHRTAYTIYFKDPEGNRLGLSHHPIAVAFTLASAQATPE